MYARYGLYKLDTPIIETNEELHAKAGGETEKQIYRFNKGDNDLLFYCYYLNLLNLCFQNFPKKPSFNFLFKLIKLFY